MADGDRAEASLLAGGYSYDGRPVRTPQFGTERTFTVALWFRAAAPDDGWQTLVKWDYLAVGLRHGLLFAHVYDPETDRERARTDLPTADLRADRWHHVAYVCDDTAATLYLDGREVDTTTHDDRIEIAPRGVCLGYIYRDRDTGVHAPEFDGRIVDARFYETRLDATTIREIVAATSPDVAGDSPV